MRSKNEMRAAREAAGRVLQQAREEILECLVRPRRVPLAGSVGEEMGKGQAEEVRVVLEKNVQIGRASCRERV